LINTTIKHIAVMKLANFGMPWHFLTFGIAFASDR
jgi:hypothetical protein